MKRETALLTLLPVLTIIGCVLSYHLGAEVERLKHDASISATWCPMSQAHTSATNQAPFDRRRRPILHVSDHIEKLIDD
jgi:cytosine/adenosine deaminase-related metal-dependent hydrolase